MTAAATPKTPNRHQALEFLAAGKVGEPVRPVAGRKAIH
jgi:hypothetical protein